MKTLIIIITIGVIHYSNMCCLNKIFNQTNKRIFIIDPHKKLDNYEKHEIVYITKLNELNNNMETLRYFKHYLILIESEDDLNKIINQLNKTNTTWKSQHFHYIHYSNSSNSIKNMTRIFEVLWDNFIYNALFINENNAYTYYPFAFTGCNNITPIYLGKCNLTFPEKIPDNFQQCELRFLTLIRPPFVINPNITPTRDNPLKQGFEVTLITNIASRINIKIINIRHEFRDWGSMQPNGTFTEMFGILQEKKADVMYGGFHYSYVPSRYFDLSVSHKIVNSAWFVPSPLEIPEWQNLLIVFKVEVWILIIVTFVIKTIYWWTITKKPLNYCFLYVFSMFLLISVRPPRKFILKMQFYICTVSFVIITTAYISKLIGVLTKPIYEKPITSVDELLLKKHIKIGFHTAYANRINDSKYYKLLEDYTKCSPGFECMNRTAFQRDFAVIKLDVQTFYMIPRVYTTASGRPMLNWFNEVIGYSHLGIYTLKGLPILNKINELVYRFVESGFVNKWEDDTKHVRGRKETSENIKASLSLYHLQTPFYILFFGFGISLFVFFIEIIVVLTSRNTIK